MTTKLFVMKISYEHIEFLFFLLKWNIVISITIWWKVVYNSIKQFVVKCFWNTHVFLQHMNLPNHSTNETLFLWKFMAIIEGKIHNRLKLCYYISSSISLIYHWYHDYIWLIIFVCIMRFYRVLQFEYWFFVRTICLNYVNKTILYIKIKIMKIHVRHNKKNVSILKLF